MEELESPKERDRDGPGSAPLVRGRGLSGKRRKFWESWDGAGTYCKNEDCNQEEGLGL